MKVMGILLGLFVVLAVTVDAQRTGAQQKPDFSGQWVLDHYRTVDRAQARVDELRRRDYAKQNLVRKVTRILSIVHKDPVMEISQRSIAEVSDRQGNLLERKDNLDFSQKLNTNDKWEERVELAEVRTRWKGVRIESTLRADAETFLVRPGTEQAFAKTTRTGYLVHTYQLSKNGKELIVETADRAFDGEDIHRRSTVRLVYRRMN